jgi:virulence-associated protein
MPTAEISALAFEKFAQYCSCFDPCPPRDKLRQLYDLIDDKEWIAAVLSKWNGKLVTIAHREPPNPALFKNSAAAKGTFGVIISILHILDFQVTGINKVFSGKAYGVGSFTPATPSAGTLYYNDAADLSGECDIECNFVSAWANINFIRKGITFATYQGAAIPTAGIYGGSGSWKSN